MRRAAVFGCRWQACMALASALLFAGGGAFAQPFNTGQVPFTNWMTALQNNGYAVTSGTVSPFQGCADFISAFASCFGNNTATPYLLTQPPVTYPNDLPAYAFTMPNGDPSGFAGMAPTNPPNEQTTDDLWQVGKNEAIVTVITLPPQGAYFGFQTYMLERDAALYGVTPPSPPCTGGAPYLTYAETEDCNFEIFGNFTNAINNADVTQIAAFSGSAWNSYDDTTNPPSPTSFKTIAIVTTPNQTLAADMMALFGGNAQTVFTEAMPATATASEPADLPKLYTCRTGVTTPRDVFTALIRFTLASSTAESTAWQTENNVLVYRVALPTVGVSASNLYDAQAVHDAVYPEGCNTNETAASGAPAGCVAATTASSGFAYDLGQIATVLQAWGSANTNNDTYATYEAGGYAAPASTNGGVGTCVVIGNNCAGGTQDTDFYRSFRAGTLKNEAPVFVVGVLHSDSPDDFTQAATVAVDNADYTGISIADDSKAYKNSGVADAANPNSASEYYVAPNNRILLGSAYTVLNSLTDGPQNTTLYSQLPSSVQQDLDNIYIHIFQRNDNQSNGSPTVCTMQTCANNLLNDVTKIVSTTGPPVTGPPVQIPDADDVLFTERGYVLAPLAGIAPGPENFTGAGVQFLQSEYIVCDTVATSCGQIQK